MGTIVTTPESCRQIVNRAGGDPSLSKYDSETSTLTAPDVTDADLTTAKAAIDARSANARPADKQAKRQQKRRQALRRHEQAILDADAQFQAELTAINAATTLADLDAI